AAAGYDDAARARGQSCGWRRGDRRHLNGDARLRRRRVLEAYERRASVPGCPRRRRHGADGRRAARIHRKGGVGHTALLSGRTLQVLDPVPRETKGKAVMNRTIWVGAVAYDPKVVSIWEGMRRYFHEEAHLVVEVVLFQSYEAQVTALLAA